MIMKTDRISNFARAGLNTDLIPWDLPGDFITNIRNVRIKNNKLTPFGGYQKRNDCPSGYSPGLFIPAGSSNSWITIGNNKAYIYKNALFVDVSPTPAFITEEDLWFGCSLSSIPVFASIDYYPLYCPDVDSETPLQLLPWDATNTWADVNQQCKIIRSHKQFLFALGVTSGGTFYPEAVRWSTPADIGSVPESWDNLDPTNAAGLAPLGGEGGAIIDGLSLRDSFIIYREKGVTVFDFVGGSYVWQIRHLTTTFGCISPNCIAEVNGMHYFIGDGDIFTNDGNSIQSLLYGRIKDTFSTSFNPDTFSNSFVINNSIAKEIWFCIPGFGSNYPNIAYIYNWKEESWTIRDIPECTAGGYGSKGSDASDAWDADSGTWDADVENWNSSGITPFNNTVMAVTPGPDSDVVQLDDLSNGSDVDFDFIIEREGYAIDGITVAKTINRIYPHSQGTGVITVELGSHTYPGSDIEWKPSVDYTVETDRKVDIRSTGMLHSFRLSGTTKVGTFSISGIDLAYTITGER
jgi:hypothetical protein